MNEPTIQDLRNIAESIVIDMEEWNEACPKGCDDIYRILMDDDTAIDLYYTSTDRLNVLMGHLSQLGPSGATITLEAMDYRINGQFITISDPRSHTNVDIDSAHIRANGVIPYDMSHFGGHPRLRA